MACPELMQQLLDLLLVGRIFAGISRGADTRRAIQGIDFQTGIVGDDGPAQVPRKAERFQGGVFLERGPRLERRRNLRICREIADGELPSEKLLKFSRLMRVPRSQDDARQVRQDRKST